MIVEIILTLVILQSSSMVSDAQGTLTDTTPPIAPDTNCWSQTTNGKNYSGTINKTLTGISCQRWDTNNDPHEMSFYSVIKFPDATISEAENYCRNPSYNVGGPWCYTKDENVRWEFCDIPVCTTQPSTQSRCTFGDTKPTIDSDAKCWPQRNNGLEYAGTVNTTSIGIACQRWDTNNDPHDMSFYSVIQFPDATKSEAESYCRNPSCTVGGPWCYTKDPGIKWGFCDIPVCTTTTSDPVTSQHLPTEADPDSSNEGLSGGSKLEMIAVITTGSIALVIIIAVVIAVFVYKTRCQRAAGAASQNGDGDIYGECNASAMKQDDYGYYSTIDICSDIKFDQSTERPLPSIPGDKPGDLGIAQNIDSFLMGCIPQHDGINNHYGDSYRPVGQEQSQQAHQIPAQTTSQSVPGGVTEVTEEYADKAIFRLLAIEQTQQGERVSIQDYTPDEREQGYIAVLQPEDENSCQDSTT